MTNPTSPASEKAWATIEKEKRLDRFIRRVSITAWSVTFALVVLVAVLVGAQVSEMMALFAGGTVPWTTVLWSVMPLIAVLWILSLLIASLSTVGIFLRLRTASLTEIQLRLAALEDMLASRGDTQK